MLKEGDDGDAAEVQMSSSLPLAAGRAPAPTRFAAMEMEIEALKRGSDGGSVGESGQATADWTAARGGQNSITSVKTDLVWPTLTDDKSDTKDVVLYYEEFEDVCALANNCRAMSARGGSSL